MIANHEFVKRPVRLGCYESSRILGLTDRFDDPAYYRFLQNEIGKRLASGVIQGCEDCVLRWLSQYT